MYIVHISGLHCEACVKLLIKKLSKIETVTGVTAGSVLGSFTVQATQPLTETAVKDVLSGTDYSLIDIS